jgi:hypothetical protein
MDFTYGADDEHNNGEGEMSRILVLLLGLLLSSASVAETSWNTMGSDTSTAISGYDVVAFHTVKKTFSLSYDSRAS